MSRADRTATQRTDAGAVRSGPVRLLPAEPADGTDGTDGADAADAADATSNGRTSDEGPSTGSRSRDEGTWASVTACPNGPLLVRGDVEILLASGEPAPRRRATVALCRCGASGIKPYCDGSHKLTGFRTDDEPT